MLNWKSWIGGVVFGAVVMFATPLRADLVPPYLDELRRIAGSLEKIATELDRSNDNLRGVREAVKDIECGSN